MDEIDLLSTAPRRDVRRRPGDGHGDGRRVTHSVGRFILDRVALRDRLVAPLVRRRVPVRLVNGSLDPNSGAHMARRYRELVPEADVVDLPRIGHWPQLEAPAEVVAAAHAVDPDAIAALLAGKPIPSREPPQGVPAGSRSR